MMKSNESFIELFLRYICVFVGDDVISLIVVCYLDILVFWELVEVNCFVIVIKFLEFYVFVCLELLYFFIDFEMFFVFICWLL